MELGLSLGNTSVEDCDNNNNNNNIKKGLCMGLGLMKGSSTNCSSSSSPPPSSSPEKVVAPPSSPPCVQLDLLPFSPVPRPPQHRFPWRAHDNLSSEPGSSDGPGSRTVEVNRIGPVGEKEEQSSPNSGTSSFMEFSLYTSTNNNNNNNNNKRDYNGENGNYGQELIGVGGGTTTSRGSDDEENGNTRKKLRLSKEQSAFLEESFKEHHTLNPKQKLALAKQLNLRARQVEVWFQNRRARTKLKQTEVDCEYLKRCCETLTEENRRLQKELQELRALKTSQPFFMQLPATTLTMCPSCERVAPTSSSATPTAASSLTVASAVGPGSVALSLAKPKRSMLPFNQAQAHQAGS